MEKNFYLKNLFKRYPKNEELYNYDLLPENFTTTTYFDICCKIHGIFKQKGSSHYCGAGCPECGALKRANNRALTTNDIIEKSMLKFGNKFNYFKTKYNRKDDVLIITCPIHGDFTTNKHKHLNYKHGCPKCDYEIPREITKNIYLENAKIIHNGKYDYSKVTDGVVTAMQKVEIICPKHGSFWQALYQHGKKGNICPDCSIEADRNTTADFIRRSKEIHGDRYIYTEVDYVRYADKVKIICPEHGEFIQRAGSHLAGNKCMGCFQKENRSSTEEFIKKAREVHGDNYDYSKVDYRQNKKPVEIICPKHGSFWQAPNTHISNRAGCKLCLDSKGERAVEVFLKKFNINYIREYRIKPHLYRYDFYLPDFNIYIEFHRIQNYKSVELFGGEKEFLLVKKRDIIKKLLVNKNKGKLIVLTYLNLNDNSVEKTIISRFKKIYRDCRQLQEMLSFKLLIESF